ncbi:MAG: [protein-PII] uridylyltransferase [Magnetococcus sp. DMHC-6]
MKLSKEKIINLAELDAKIQQIVEKSTQTNQENLTFDALNRGELLALFKETLKTGWEHLHQYHLKGWSGPMIVNGHTFVVDALLHRLHALVFGFTQFRRDLKKEEKIISTSNQSICLIATGGYGREELAPFSDIDLLFLLPAKLDPLVSHRVEQVLYFLWDMGWEVGHAVRNIEECIFHARKEVEILTSLLESRFLTGDPELFKNYRTQLEEQVLLHNPDAFFRAKLLEQRKRHEKFGNSMFYLEPNIKENRGGLRDIHTFFWISKYRYHVQRVKDLIAQGILKQEEYNTFNRCRAFLQKVRNALHYRAGRRDDRLTFDHQIAIAAEFGYQDRLGQRGVEQFMRRYYLVASQVGTLSQIFLQKYQDELHKTHGLTRQHLEGPFYLYGDKIQVIDPQAFQKKKSNLLRIFKVAQSQRKSIHPDTLRLVNHHLNLINQNFRSNPEVNDLFIEMLNGETAVGWVLRCMNTNGFLGRFIPEFGRIIGQTQHDLFHIYTVDEHTILAVEALRQIKAGKFSEELPISTGLINQVQKPFILYLGVLFHDIAKGRQGDHSKEGAKIARKICARMGISQQDTDLIVWLVEHHLLFSQTAFHRDINDPHTVSQFADQIENKERLDLLILLTVADIRAVGPKTWNQWKATLLRKLYVRSLVSLNNDPQDSPEERIARRAEAQKQAVYQMLIQRWDPFLVKEYIGRFYPDYFVNYNAETIVGHFANLIPTRHDALTVVLTANTYSATTEMLLHTADHPGLIVKISGTLAALNVNILHADIYTTKDGMAMDVFVLEDWLGGAIENETKLNRIKKTLQSVIQGRTNPETLLAATDPGNRRQDTFVVPTKIESENGSDHHTVLEISTKDRLGLLFLITRIFRQHGLQIRTAKIATYGERAVDAFYLRDLYGRKLSNSQVEQVKKSLYEVLDNPNANTDPWSFLLGKPNLILEKHRKPT